MIHVKLEQLELRWSWKCNLDIILCYWRSDWELHASEFVQLYLLDF